MFEDLVFPGVAVDNWQMMQWEKIALTGLLSRIKPKGAMEIGVYHGGSLSLTWQYSEHIVAIDIDPEVANRVNCPPNVDLRIGSSVTLVPEVLREFVAADRSLNFVLIDADHSREGVRRDIELVLQYEPREPMLILMHDSGNPETRRGILEANWAANPRLKFIDCDFVPGQIIEHSVSDGRGEVWGGLALAYLDADLRTGAVEIRESARSSVRSLHYCMDKLNQIDSAAA